METPIPGEEHRPAGRYVSPLSEPDAWLEEATGESTELDSWEYAETTPRRPPATRVLLVALLVVAGGVLAWLLL